jgi:hypothetical protein
VNWPVSVVINCFYPKQWAGEGAEHLLAQLAAQWHYL